jgi:hypothetical protein
MSQKVSELVRLLEPYFVRLGIGVNGAGVGGSSGESSLQPHDLSGGLHRGQLGREQATWVAEDIQAALDAFCGVWATVEFNTGWDDAGMPHAPVTWRQMGRAVFLRGRCYVSSPPGQHLFSLPVYPPWQQSVMCMTSLGVRSMSIKATNGDVVPDGWSPGIGNWVDLNGVWFFVD